MERRDDGPEAETHESDDEDPCVPPLAEQDEELGPGFVSEYVRQPHRREVYDREDLYGDLEAHSTRATTLVEGGEDFRHEHPI